MTVIVARANGPEGRLRPVIGAVSRTVLHRVPTGLVLPVVVAAREREPIFRPDDLCPQRESCLFQGRVDDARVQAGVPHVRDIPRKQPPGRCPVGTIVVRDGAELVGVQVHAGACPPSRVVIDPVWGIGHHQKRTRPIQHAHDVVRLRAIATQQAMLVQRKEIASLDRRGSFIGNDVGIGQTRGGPGLRPAPAPAIVTPS